MQSCGPPGIEFETTAIEHNKVFIVPPSGQESSFPFISFSDADQVIGTSKVELGVNSGLVQLFQGRGD